MEQVLLVVQVILAVGLIGMVLIQRSESDGFGLGGGGGGVISGRTQANLMTRTTAIFAALFIINSLGLSVLASQGRNSSSSITDVIEQQQKTDAKGAPVVPTSMDTDKKAEKQLAVPMPEKKVDAKPEAKDAPAVPTDTDAKKDAPKAVDAKPAAPAQKVVKKAAAPSSDEPDHNK